MSQKTDLQSNNTDLQTILNTINNLPEAGGSSGGGSVETCTVTIRGEAPSSGMDYIWYMDGTATVKSVLVPDFIDNDVTIQVVKNSIICAPYGLSASGGVARIELGVNGFHVTGDGTLISM